MSAAPQVVAVPELHLVAIAKTTRKTFERLASFSHMRSAPSEPSAVLNRIVAKINGLIRKIDNSMMVAQMGYQLSTNAMIVCDAEGMDWELEGDATRDGLADQAKNAHEMAQCVMDAFRDIRQEVYKIAAATKDNMLLVYVPPDPSHAETMKIHLRDVGADLVANLNLLSEYSRAMNNVGEWWQIVKDDLTSKNPRLLPPLPGAAQPESQTNNDVSGSSGSSPLPPRVGPDHFTQWMDMKQGFQEYYNVVNTVHVRYPDLLPASSAAWTAVANAQSREPSSAGQSQTDLQRASSQAPSAEMPPPAHTGTMQTGLSSASISRAGRILSLFRFRRRTARTSRNPEHGHSNPTITTGPPTSSSLQSASVQTHGVSVWEPHTEASGEPAQKKEQTQTKGSKISCRSLSIIPSFIGHLGCHGIMIR